MTETEADTVPDSEGASESVLSADAEAEAETLAIAAIVTVPDVDREAVSVADSEVVAVTVHVFGRAGDAVGAELAGAALAHKAVLHSDAALYVIEGVNV